MILCASEGEGGDGGKLLDEQLVVTRGRIKNKEQAEQLTTPYSGLSQPTF